MWLSLANLWGTHTSEGLSHTQTLPSCFGKNSPSWTHNTLSHTWIKKYEKYIRRVWFFRGYTAPSTSPPSNHSWTLNHHDNTLMSTITSTPTTTLTRKHLWTPPYCFPFCSSYKPSATSFSLPHTQHNLTETNLPQQPYLTQTLITVDSTSTLAWKLFTAINFDSHFDSLFEHS